MVLDNKGGDTAKERNLAASNMGKTATSSRDGKKTEKEQRRTGRILDEGAKRG